MPRKSKMTTKEMSDLSFLVELDKRIWKISNEGVHPSSSTIGQYYIEKDGEFLSKKDWETIKELIKKNNLICTPGAGVFGFGRSIAFYQRPPAAPYPGTEGAQEPEYLLSFTNHHMEKVLGTSSDYDEWWKEMESLVYNEKNKALIKEFMPKKQQLREKSYYEY